MPDENPESNSTAPPGDVAVSNGFALPAVAITWCVSAFVGSAVGSLGFLVFTYVTGVEPATTLPPAPPEHDDGTVCYTPGCLATTAYLKDSLNPLVDPCRNFPEYVCGRFHGGQGSNLLGPSRIFLEALNMTQDYLKSPSGGARFKAAVMLNLCAVDAIVGSFPGSTELQAFMHSMKLYVHSPPADAPTGGDELLMLHVELAYVYGISALMVIRPRARRSLHVDFNRYTLARVLLEVRNHSRCAHRLASISGFGPSPDLGVKMQSVHQTLQGAIASAQNTGGQNAATRVVIKVKDLAFAGVNTTAFADAIVAKTPYTRDASLFESPKLKAILEAVWQAMDKTDLLLWTSWQTLETLDISARNPCSDQATKILRCLERISHVMDAALASIIRPPDVVEKARVQVAVITKSIASCLSRKQWTPSVPTSPRLVVGLPSYASTPERMEAFFKAFQLYPGSFTLNWLAAVEVRRRILSPDDDHLDSLAMDAYVDTDGTMLVPAALFTVPLFVPDGPMAANIGGLGLVIAKGIVDRYFVGAGTVPAACLSLAGQKHGVDIETLLAYTCVRNTLSSMNSSQERRLPQLASLSPEKMAYTVGCLKDCTTPPSGPGICSSAQGLKEFEEAFACRSEGRPPPCRLD